MSQDAFQEQAAPAPQQVPIIVLYHQQLAHFKQQREQAKIQFEQLNGAIFACENMIKQYEDNAKQAALDLANKVALKAVTPDGHQGEMNGQANDQAKKQASQK